MQYAAVVHSHTNITQLGGLAVLITYARNTRVCVRERKVVVSAAVAMAVVETAVDVVD